MLVERCKKSEILVAFLSSAIAFLSWPACTPSLGLYPRILTLSGYTSLPRPFWMSLGKSTTTGPGLPVRAI